MKYDFKIKLNKKEKKLLYVSYINQMGDMVKIRNMDTFKLYTLSQLMIYMIKSKKYFSGAINIVNELQDLFAEQKLFESVSDGNMKSTELYLKRVDEKSTNKTTETPAINFIFSKDFGKEKNKVESSREINDMRDENECSEK